MKHKNNILWGAATAFVFLVLAQGKSILLVDGFGYLALGMMSAFMVLAGGIAAGIVALIMQAVGEPYQRILAFALGACLGMGIFGVLLFFYIRFF